MSAQITCAVVHRVHLPVDPHGEITTAVLDRVESPYPEGASLVLDVGPGQWVRLDEIRRAAANLRHLRHVTVTGTYDGPSYMDARIACGLEAIGSALKSALSASPLQSAA